MNYYSEHISLEDIMTKTKYLVAIYKNDLTIVGVNNVLANFYGYEPNDLIGKNVLDIVPNFKQSVFYECCMHTIKYKKEISRLGYSVLFNGWFATRTMMYDENHSVLIAHALSEDINYAGFVPIYDSLTALYNLYKFNEDITKNINENKKFNIILFEIINLEKIYEIYGFYHSDCLIMEVSGQLKLSFHKENILEIYKISNNQFGLIHTLDSKNTIEIVEKLKNMFSLPLKITTDEKIKLNISIVSRNIQNNNKDVNKILEETFNTLKSAKKKKEFYLEFDEKTYLNKKNILIELKEAFKNKEFILYYQPQIDTITNKVCGMEALLRWNNKEKGILSPDKFLNLIEDFELNELMDKYVIKEAINDCVFFKKNKINIPISINLTSESFSNINIVDFIQSEVEKNDITSKNLIIEITENALMKNIELSKKVIKYFSAKEFKIAIDDFGSGYSSFGYLIRYPTDYLKIDKEFVQNINTQDNLKQIMRNLVNMAHSLKMLVVAEGVEFESEANVLKKLDVDIIQGYYYSKPLKKEDALNKINKTGVSYMKSNF